MWNKRELLGLCFLCFVIGFVAGMGFSALLLSDSRTENAIPKTVFLEVVPEDVSEICEKIDDLTALILEWRKESVVVTGKDPLQLGYEALIRYK